MTTATLGVRVITFGDGRLNALGALTRKRLFEDLGAAESDKSGGPEFQCRCRSYGI